MGVNTIEHVQAMPNALTIELTTGEIRRIQEAADFKPLFPVDFLYNYRKDQPYNTGFTATNNEQYQMAAWIQAPPKQQVSHHLVIWLTA